LNLCTITTSVSRNAGGLFNSVRALNQALAALPGIRVSVVSLQDAFTADDLPAWEPLQPTVFSSPGPRSFGYSPGLRTAVLNSNADLLHLHGIWQFPSVVALQWRRRTGKPYVISPRGMLDSWALNNSKWKKRAARWLFEDAHLQKAACIQALCESEAQSIRTLGLKNPIAIIPNGVDLPEIGNPKSEIGNPPWAGALEPGRKVLLYLGRFHPKKGLVTLLKAWKSAINSQPSTFNPWLLALAGWDQGAHEAELKQLATDLGFPWADVRNPGSTGDSPKSSAPFSHSPLRTPHSALESASLVFTGPLFGREKEAAYRHCDAFILPSFSEGLPMAVLEAWAYGKPVLMTPECNLPEGFTANAAIRIEQVGRVTPCAPGSAFTIEAGLHELFRLPPSALRVMGEKGRLLVAERFNWPRIARQMKAVYDWVIGGGTPPPCVVLK
jgi:glycosyltransferase involved in cell wall biosynthesis